MSRAITENTRYRTSKVEGYSMHARSDNLYHALSIFQDLRVLDAGCGTGRYSKALVDLGVGKISLLDSSPEMLKVAAKKLKTAIDTNIVDKITEAILPDLPFDDGNFDAVMYNYVSIGTSLGQQQNCCTITSCITTHRYPIYHGTSEIERGLCACTVDNPLAKARGLSLRTGARTMFYLSLSILRTT